MSELCYVMLALRYPTLRSMVMSSFRMNQPDQLLDLIFALETDTYQGDQ